MRIFRNRINNFKPKVTTQKNVFVVSSQPYKPVKNIKPNASYCKLGRNIFKISAAECSDGHFQSAHKKKTKPAYQPLKKSTTTIIKPESFNQTVYKYCINRENKKTVGILGVNNKLLKNSKETKSERVKLPLKRSISQVKTAEKIKNKVSNCKQENLLPEKSRDSLTKNASKSLCETSLQFHNENELTHGSGKVKQLQLWNIVKPVDCTKEHTSFEEPYNIPDRAENNEISYADSGNESSVFSLDSDRNFVIEDEKGVVKTEHKEHGETEEKECNATLTKPTDEPNLSFTIEKIVITLGEVKEYKTSPGKSITSIANFQPSNNQVKDKCISQNKNTYLNTWTETADHKKLIKRKQNKINDEVKSFQKRKTTVEHEPGNKVDGRTPTMQPNLKTIKSPENMSSPNKLKTKHSFIFSETTPSMDEENPEIEDITPDTDNTTSSRKIRKIQYFTCEPDFEKLIPGSKPLKKRRLSSSISSVNLEESISSDIDSDATIMSQSQGGTSKNKTKRKRKMWTSTPQSGCQHLPSLQAFKSRLEQHSFENNLSVVDELENQSDITSKEILHDLMEEVQTTIIASEEDFEKLSRLNIQITWKLSALHRVDNATHHLRVSQILSKNPHLEIDTSKFSRDEEERIKRNWQKFSKKYEFDNPSIFMYSHQLYPYFRQEERLKFKQFIARKLPNRRLASVYRKFVDIFTVLSKGRWSKTEDQLLLTLNNAYDTLDENSYEIPKKTMLAKALGRNWMSIHRRLATLLRDNSTTQLMAMEIDWNGDLEGRMIHYLLRYTGSGSIEDLRFTKITSRVWCKVAAKLELPMVRIVRRWNNHLYPQLYSRRPVLRRDLYIELIKWFHDHEIRTWRDIDWADLSVRCGDLGRNFLYHCFISLVNNYTPKKVAKDCRAAIDYLHTEYLPKLLKKRTSTMLKRVTYDPKARTVLELEEDEAEFSSFRII